MHADHRVHAAHPTIGDEDATHCGNHAAQIAGQRRTDRDAAE